MTGLTTRETVKAVLESAGVTVRAASTMVSSKVTLFGSVLGVPAEAIRHVTVPGALEVPLALQALAESNDFDALIALGCIIRGETYHFELVANESGAAVTRVGLDHGIPIANAILTVENEAQAWARAEPKGRDAARVAVEMANLLKEIE